MRRLEKNVGEFVEKAGAEPAAAATERTFMTADSSPEKSMAREAFEGIAM